MIVNEQVLMAADYKSEREVGEALAEAFRTGLVQRGRVFSLPPRLVNFNPL